MRNINLIIVIGAALALSVIVFWQSRYSDLRVELIKRSIPMEIIKITSNVFVDNGNILPRFTCDGANVSPPLEIAGVPGNAKSLVFIMHDPDAPRAGGWTHWIKFNMSPKIQTIKEDEEPLGESGKGSGGSLRYEGPCPPSGTHHYIFRVYGLDSTLNLPIGVQKEQLEQSMAGHIVAQGELVGLYSRMFK